MNRMKELEKLEKERKRISQKITFFKRYIKHLIRIALGSIIATIFFIYLMDIVHIDLQSLKISTISLTLLATTPTIIPLVISSLLHTQIKELNAIIENLNKKIKKLSLET